MKLNNIFLNTITVLILFLIACNDSSQVIENGIPQIVGISKQTTFHFDVLTVYGKYFGEVTENSHLLFIEQTNKDTLLKLPAKDCIKWTGTEISFRVSDKLVSCNVAVCSDGKTSNKISITVSNLPVFEMIEIQPGTFSMGSDWGFANERPVHQVIITKNYYIAKFEISQLIWENVMGYNNSYINDKNLPVHNIDWLEAIRFCNAISNRMKYDSCYIFVIDSTVQYDTTANGYRLPTEAEWEFACKAGNNLVFEGMNPEDIAWFNINSGYSPHPSGTLLSNDFGLFDMHGNIWEWCWDWYSGDYYHDSLMINPKGPQNGSRRVLRGGSCASGTAYIRAANRAYPESDYKYCGLRLVRTKYE
ncbi:MAG: SUMF1/EgtB/PvdO family nonheme iron enzyme [bacterium]